MQRSAWSTPADPDVVARRAAGRSAYNAHRQLTAHLRVIEVGRLLGAYSAGTERGIFTRGLQARIARTLGVSRATVCRDVRRFWDEQRQQVCQYCGYNRALGLRICFHGPHE